MPSTPQDQDQNQEPSEETRGEVKAEENENKKEESRKEKKKEAKKEDKDEKKESWKDFIYNPGTGEFLGRTASSWGKSPQNQRVIVARTGSDSVYETRAVITGLIFLFYLVFYGFLAGMFALTMWVMLQTLDENVPRHQDRVANPGLVIRPHAAEIFFNRSDVSNYNQYVQQLHELLQPYNDSVQEQNDLCLVGEYTQQDDEATKKVCQFKRSVLHYCSGLRDPTFGYAAGKPCVIVRMNRVVGLKPRGDPYVNCTSKVPTFHIHSFPNEGHLDKMYFPYYGKKLHPDYVQPLVAVKLNLAKGDFNVEHVVECKLEGTNLRNDDDRDKFQGRVTFRVKVSE